MSFLSKLSQLKKTKTSIVSTSCNVNNPPVNDTDISLLPKYYIREKDPAIERLKNARRKEQLKNGTLKKDIRPCKSKNEEHLSETRFKKKSGISTANSTVTTKKTSDKLPMKKLTFDELMRQAEDKSKKLISEPVKLVSKKQFPKVNFKKEGFKITNRTLSSECRTGKPPAIKLDTLKVNASLAKPNEYLRRKLEDRRMVNHKQMGDDEDDYSLNGFIDDDELDYDSPAVGNRGYDKDEIWAIFNRGRKRAVYYDDDDDMETNEIDILEEEEASSKIAKLEDKKEELWLKRHEMKKMRR